MSFLQAIILAIVEGITEFLPVSSTGHMIIAEAFMKMSDPEFTKVFIVNIQFGAILSVVVLYWRRFIQSFDFYLKLFVAFLPAAFFGFLLGDYIDLLLENVAVVAFMLLAGGIVLVFVDDWFPGDGPETPMTYKKALTIGFFQCIAMVPGVSRSAATIIGGLTQRLNRKEAAEFSFFLAVPTMFAASAYKLLKSYETIRMEHINLLILGNLVAFIIAMIAIKTFISFLTKHGFRVFGYYRILIAVLLIILLISGYDLQIV
ncbi:MAG TPA: undecaprenyl-diphosphate phosphatase [Bacteroidia bacterium]|nr:undecaprenyl-diphosphate phosphatase [Bacteroidia bacterium]HNT80778.1 undecaprenyl-diphosphate phosphatase [Bacteroidia bacterium]